MGLLKKLFTNCACPQGRMGRAMLKFMNLCHAPLTNWGLKLRSSRQDNCISECYFPFLNSLGFMPFILLKKRAKVVTSAKWSWSEIWVMLSEV